MRSSLTLSEARLWEALRGSKLGVGFRRQVPIGEYIVDFLAPSARPIVEVDEGYHADRASADARHRASRRISTLPRVDNESLRRSVGCGILHE